MVMWMMASTFANADLGAPATSHDLEGYFWRVASISHFDNSYPSNDDVLDAYLTFKNGEISGNLGCGQLTGRYSFSNNNVQISAAWTDHTLHCGPTIRQQAPALIASLNGMVRLEIGREGTLFLLGKRRSDYVHLELVSPGFDFSELSNTFWRLVSFEGKVIDEPNAEVQIEARKIEISSGGYKAAFAYRYNGKKLSFDGPSSVAYPNIDSNQPPLLLKRFGLVLKIIASYTTNRDELAILNASGEQIMLLKRIYSTGLEYRLWRISEYAADGKLVYPVRPTRFQATFVRGKLSGIAGCRGLSGTYTLAGNNLSVKAGDLGMGYCTKRAETEMRLVQTALNKVSRLREDGARVLLQDNQGNTNVVLTPVELTSHMQ